MTKQNEAVEEVKPIAINYNGTDYIMEFSRKTADLAENQMGINVQELIEGKFARLPEFVWCSFLMHHPKMKLETAENILILAGDKRGLITELIKLYYAPINTLLEEPEEGKALSWRAI